MCRPFAAPAPAQGRRRIVLIEDNDDMRGIFREMLEHSGHHVRDARDGREGVAFILAERPDVALINIGLPGMDGFEVARGAHWRITTPSGR